MATKVATAFFQSYMMNMSNKEEKHQVSYVFVELFFTHGNFGIFYRNYRNYNNL